MMRRLAPLIALAAAGCATAPRQPATVVQPGPPPAAPQQRGGLIGLSAGDLLQRFGTPALQVREGAGLKLQFRSPTCVLDAYLYPPPQGGAERVTHVDSRLVSGVDTDQRGCIAALGGD